MSCFSGPADWWTEGTDAGRTHIATKGVVQANNFLSFDAGCSSSYSGSGSTWTDLIGGKTATMLNTTFSSINGGVINHNGTSAYSTIANTAYTLGSSFSIELWSYWNSPTPPAQNPFVGCMYTNSANPPSGDWNSGAGNNIGLLIGFASLRYRSTPSNLETAVTWTNPTTQAWHHYVFTLNSGTGIVYLDTVQVHTASNYQTTFPTTLATYGIGKSDNNGSPSSPRGFWNGYISNFRIYTGKTLTQIEVTQNYNALRTRFGV